LNAAALCAFCARDLRNQGVFSSTTGLNRTEAPSRFVRTRTRGDDDDTEFDAYVIV
jgi:hypothetical protein